MAEEVKQPTLEDTEVDFTNEEVQDETTDNDVETEEQDTEETQEEQAEEHQEEEEFNPDELDLETDDMYKINDYDLTKYKDRIDLSNDTVRQNLENVSRELKEQGFTQSQVEFLLDKELNTLKDMQEVERKPESIKKELSEVLTIQEKRNYKAVGGYVKELIKDDAKMEKAYNEIMGNPYIVKLLNKAYMKSLGGKEVNTVKTGLETNTKRDSVDDSIEKLNNALKLGKATDEFIKQLRHDTTDVEQLDIYLKAIGKI